METVYLVAALAFFVTAFIYGLMALLVWHKSVKAEGDWVFLFAMVACAFWCLSNALVSSFGTVLEKPNSPLGWMLLQTSYPLLYMVPPSIRHCMVLSQLSVKGWRRGAHLALNYLGIVPVVLHLQLSSRPLTEHYGPAFSILLFTYLSLTIVEITKRKQLRAQYAEKSGSRIVTQIGLGGALLLATIPPFFCLFYPEKTDAISLIGKFAALPPAFAVAYSVLRYRFMDMVLKRSLLYSTLSCLLLGLYLLGVRYGAEWLFPEAGLHSVVFDFMMIFVLIFAFQPLKEGLQRAIDRLFFCSCRSLRSADMQKSLSQTLTSWSDLEALCRGFVEKVIESLRLSYGVILLDDGTTYSFQSASSSSSLSQEKAVELRSLLMQADLPVVVVEELPASSLKTACREAAIGLAVALPCREQWNWLLLGEKLSGGPFLSEETTQVEATCGQLAVSLDNFHLIQEKMALERDMQHQEKLAAIGQLAATVAHEIRNPITGAKCLLQQVEEELSRASQGKEYVDLALEDLERVEQSISQLLAFARKEEYHFNEQNVNEIVGETVQRLAARAQEKGVTVRFAGHEPVWAVVDEEKIRRTLVNLLENAVDATAEGGVVVASVGTAGPTVEIGVHDTGHGFTPEDQEKIFEPFFTRKEKGTGLGLAIAKKIIEGHGGRIRVVSTPGQGTAFTLVLPRQRSNPRVAA